MPAEHRNVDSELPPRGHYLAHEVGHLAGVSGSTVGQWKRRGYIRASQESDEYPNVYSYQDVAEAIVVHELVLLRIELQDIGRATAELRQVHGTSWPLTRTDLRVARYGDDATGSLIVMDADTAFDLSKHKYRWQAVITSDHLSKIASELNRGGWAVRELPDLQHIEVNPDRLSGRPVIRGTRIPVVSVASTALGPDGWQEAIGDYDLTSDQVGDAVRWWRAVARYEAAAA